MKIILFFFILGTAIASLAVDKTEDCPTENLTSSFGAARGHGGAEWCWANAVSDLIGYYQGVKPPDRISAVDVGISYFNSNQDSLAKGIGIPTQYLPQEYKDFLLKIQEKMKDKYIDEIQGSPVLATYAYQGRPGYCLEKNISLDYSDQKSYITEYINSLNVQINRGHVFNCITETDPTKKLQNFRLEMNKQLLSQMDRDLETQCKPRTPMKPMNSFRVDLNTDSLKRKATDIIKTKLKARVPVGIAFDSDLLFKNDYGNRANHIVIVTESQLVNGQCQYRVRDAQGTDCSIYRNSIQARCENGNIWLTSDEINKSTEYLMGIEQL